MCVGGTQSEPISGCAPATIALASAGIAGTLALAADGTWSNHFTETFSATISLAPGCFDATACQQFQADLVAQAGIDHASCHPGSACTCTYAGTTQVDKTGTYTTSGSGITLASAGATPETDSYCVAGNTLTLAFALKGATSTAVFTRQGG